MEQVKSNLSEIHDKIPSNFQAGAVMDIQLTLTQNILNKKG